jgi:hypothetical protein
MHAGFDTMARRVSYASWRGANRLGEELLVWNYRLTPEQLPHWTLQYVQAIGTPGWPPSIQSAWSHSDGGLALFDVFECSTREAAHVLLVDLLGNVESARLEREEDAPLGDVTFGHEDAPVSLFARANVVFFLRAADPAPMPIRETAARLDEELISKPEPARDEALPAIEQLRAERDVVRPGEAVALEVTAVDPMREPLWYKAFTSSGELRLSEGRPVYRHTAAGPPSISVYAVAPGRGAARRDLKLSSEPPEA